MKMLSVVFLLCATIASAQSREERPQKRQWLEPGLTFSTGYVLSRALGERKVSYSVHLIGGVGQGFFHQEVEGFVDFTPKLDVTADSYVVGVNGTSELWANRQIVLLVRADYHYRAGDWQNATTGVVGHKEVILVGGGPGFWVNPRLRLSLTTVGERFHYSENRVHQYQFRSRWTTWQGSTSRWRMLTDLSVGLERYRAGGSQRWGRIAEGRIGFGF